MHNSRLNRDIPPAKGVLLIGLKPRSPRRVLDTFLASLHGLWITARATNPFLDGATTCNDAATTEKWRKTWCNEAQRNATNRSALSCNDVQRPSIEAVASLQGCFEIHSVEVKPPFSLLNRGALGWPDADRRRRLISAAPERSQPPATLPLRCRACRRPGGGARTFVPPSARRRTATARQKRRRRRFA
jgi:hypothetical protein